MDIDEPLDPIREPSKIEWLERHCADYDFTVLVFIGGLLSAWNFVRFCSRD